MTLDKINPEDKNSWFSKIYIEIDIDWAHEKIIDDTISLLEEYKVGATFFATHKSNALLNIAKDSLHEIGIHPNFIPLLKGDHSNGKDFKEVVNRIMDIFPDSKCTKGHSLVDSSILIQYYGDIGITHDNTYLIDTPVMDMLAPWRLWNNIVRVPLYWEDDYHCVTKNQRNFDKVINTNFGLKVFGFHPLHIFLNTESLNRYELVRSFQNNPDKLINYRYTGEGTRSRFVKLLNLISNKSKVS